MMDTLSQTPPAPPLAAALAALRFFPAPIRPGCKSLREAARTRLGEIGFPDTGQEDWRFTNVAPLLELPLHTARQNGRKVLAAGH